MTDTIGSVGLEDSEAFIRAKVDELLQDVPRTEDERLVWSVTLATVSSGLEALAKQPLTVDVHWPSGMNKAQRQTLHAQLDLELKRAHLRRLAAEMQVLLGLAPGIALGFCALAATEEGQRMAQETIAALTPRPTIAQRIAAALRRAAS